MRIPCVRRRSSCIHRTCVTQPAQAQGPGLAGTSQSAASARLTGKFSASDPTTPEALFFWRPVLHCELSCAFSQPQLQLRNSAEDHVVLHHPPLPPTNDDPEIRGGIGPPRAALDLNELYMTGPSKLSCLRTSAPAGRCNGQEEEAAGTRRCTS